MSLKTPSVSLAFSLKAFIWSYLKITSSLIIIFWEPQLLIIPLLIKEKLTFLNAPLNEFSSFLKQLHSLNLRKHVQ